MGTISYANKISHEKVDFKDKVCIMSTDNYNVEDIYEYNLYNYHNINISIINQENDIMYKNVYDNYIKVLAYIAKMFDDKFNFKKIDIGLLLIGKHHVKTYIKLEEASIPLLFPNRNIEKTTANKILTKLIDEVRNKNIGINGTIDHDAIKDLYLTTDYDWEMID